MQKATGYARGRVLAGGLLAVRWASTVQLPAQLEGIDRANAEGKYRGRAPTARAKADEVRELDAKGLSLSQIAKRLSIGKASVHRILNA